MLESCSPICYGEGKDWDLVSNHAHQGHKSGSLQIGIGCQKACSFCADFFSSALSPGLECARTGVLDWQEVGWREEKGGRQFSSRKLLRKEGRLLS